MNNMGEFLVMNADRYPDKTAIIYREFNERVNRLAHHLLDLGVRKGDRVGFMLYNSNQFMEILYAALKIGAISVPLNFRIGPPGGQMDLG